VGAAHAQVAPTTKSAVQMRRWQAALDAFAAEDRAHAPEPGGVLFVGSSSIRLWSSLQAQFKDVPVVQRGFGGSRLVDCTDHLQQLVVPYRPRLVVLYAGDNDLAEGRSPQEVVDSLRAFVDGVRGALPGTRIAYVSIKPSPLRASLMPKVREANALAQAYLAQDPQLAYVDVFSAMVDPQGQPRRELFLPDALHLNAQGYAVWQSALASVVR
jgi:lysophospholipase L1-like esterase